jgi:hypothetical protein
LKTIIELIDERDKAIDAAREAARVKHENELRVEMLTRAIISMVKNERRNEQSVIIGNECGIA